jgi:hypothetical protein
VGKNHPSVPVAAERTVVAWVAASARIQSLDLGHQAYTPCIGRVVLKERLDHTSEGSNVVALENCTMPAHQFSGFMVSVRVPGCARVSFWYKMHDEFGDK